MIRGSARIDECTYGANKKSRMTHILWFVVSCVYWFP